MGPLIKLHSDPYPYTIVKKCFLLAVAIFVTTTVSAQSYFNNDRVGYNDYYQPRIGFEGDYVFSSAVAKDNGVLYFNPRKIAGFRVGFNFDLPVQYPVTFSTGLFYSQKGFIANTPSGDYTQNFKFVEIPLLAKIRAGHWVNIYFGPQLSIVVKASDTYNTGFVEADKQYYNYYGTSSIVNGVIGAGFNITPQINVHARYTLDVTGINSNGDTRIPFYRNQTVQVGIGFKLLDPIFK